LWGRRLQSGRQNDRALRPDQLACVFCRSECAPETQVERLPRLLERCHGKLAKLQRLAGREHQMVESADPVEQAAYLFLVGQIERHIPRCLRAAMPARGPGCVDDWMPPRWPRLPARRLAQSPIPMPDVPPSITMRLSFKVMSISCIWNNLFAWDQHGAGLSLRRAHLCHSEHDKESSLAASFDNRLLGGVGVLAGRVEAGSFVGVPPERSASRSPGVSRAVARLEERVGVRAARSHLRVP